MPMSSFVCDGEVKEEVKEITPILGLNHNYSYVLPEKYQTLERGDGSRFLQETSFINTTTPTYSPPTPPIDCESLE